MFLFCLLDYLFLVLLVLCTEPLASVSSRLRLGQLITPGLIVKILNTGFSTDLSSLSFFFPKSSQGCFPSSCQSLQIPLLLTSLRFHFSFATNGHMNYFVLVSIKSKNLTLPLSRWSLLIPSSGSLGSALLLRPDMACTMLELGWTLMRTLMLITCLLLLVESFVLLKPFYLRY